MVAEIFKVSVIFYLVAVAIASDTCEQLTYRGPKDIVNFTIAGKDLHPITSEIVTAICKVSPELGNLVSAVNESADSADSARLNTFEISTGIEYDPRTDSFIWTDGVRIFQTFSNGTLAKVFNRDLAWEPIPRVQTIALDPSSDRLYLSILYLVGVMRLDERQGEYLDIDVVNSYGDQLHPGFLLSSSMFVDSKNEYLFVQYDNRIIRSKLDGTENTTVVYFGNYTLELTGLFAANLSRFQLDRSSDRLYWSTVNDTIYSSDLDGKDVRELKIVGNNDSKLLLRVDSTHVYYMNNWPVLARRADKITGVEDPDFEIRDDRDTGSMFHLSHILNGGGD